MQIYDRTCIRCRLHPSDATQGVLICSHCRLIILNKVFSLAIPNNLLAAAYSATKPWNHQSLRSLFEVSYSRQRRTGSSLDHWLIAMYASFNMAIPDPPPRLRGIPSLNIKGNQPASAEQAKIIKRVRKQAAAIRAKQEQTP